MKNDELLGALREAKASYKKLVSDYPDYRDYPPIYNSFEMLQKIEDHIHDTNYLEANQDQLNVGLLAAKSLDFHEKNTPFYLYASSLHNTWGAFMAYIGKRFIPPTKGKKLIAYNFYKNQGYDDSEIGSHFDGIDFSYPVAENLLRKKKIISQWKAKLVPKGNYYADVSSKVKPTCLGIHDEQRDLHGNICYRIFHEYEVNSDVKVLKSTAASVLDIWSIKGQSFPTRGGCIQYFKVFKRNQIRQIHLVK